MKFNIGDRVYGFKADATKMFGTVKSVNEKDGYIYIAFDGESTQMWSDHAMYNIYKVDPTYTVGERVERVYADGTVVGAKIKKIKPYSKSYYYVLVDGKSSIQYFSEDGKQLGNPTSYIRKKQADSPAPETTDKIKKGNSSTPFKPGGNIFLGVDPCIPECPSNNTFGESTLVSIKMLDLQGEIRVLKGKIEKLNLLLGIANAEAENAQDINKKIKSYIYNDLD